MTIAIPSATGVTLLLMPPCQLMNALCREMWAFANNDDIRKAIHAEPISKIGRFDECSDRITYTHDTDSMIPIHADLVSKGKTCLASM